jgi:hypothetical protein
MASSTAKYSTDPIEPVSLADIQSELAALRELIERRLPAPLPARQWLTIEQATALAGRSPQAVRGWCRTQRIGVLVKGQWQVDRVHLRALLVERFGEHRLPAALRNK